MTSSNKIVTEWAIYQLKEGSKEKFSTLYPILKSQIEKESGFISLQTYQNLVTPNEYMDIVVWQSIEAAKAADNSFRKTQIFSDLAKLMETLSFFHHGSKISGINTFLSQKHDFLEFYRYVVATETRDTHLSAKRSFATYLSQHVAGFASMEWYELEKEDEGQIDLYGYNNNLALLASNAAIEEHPIAEQFMQTIKEFQEFKTFVPLQLKTLKSNPTADNLSYYTASEEVEVYKSSGQHYLSLTGKGAPESEQFNLAIPKLYEAATKILNHYRKFNFDYELANMECYWSVDGTEFTFENRHRWEWEIMIPLPSFIHPSNAQKYLLNTSQVKVKAEHNELFVQKLHKGSYDEEEESLSLLFTFMKQNDLKMAGRHREIYLNDPRKTAIEDLRTIIRYAVQSINRSSQQ